MHFLACGVPCRGVCSTANVRHWFRYNNPRKLTLHSLRLSGECSSSGLLRLRWHRTIQLKFELRFLKRLLSPAPGRYSQTLGRQVLRTPQFGRIRCTCRRGRDLHQGGQDHVIAPLGWEINDCGPKNILLGSAVESHLPFTSTQEPYSEGIHSIYQRVPNLQVLEKLRQNIAVATLISAWGCLPCTSQ